MPLAALYKEISQRHLQAAVILNDGGYPEVAVFNCYHSWESIACAALVSFGVTVPRRHEPKINAFMARFKGRGFTHGSASLATKLLPLRNGVLYPKAGSLDSIVTTNEVDILIRRVRGILNSVVVDLGL